MIQNLIENDYAKAFRIIRAAFGLRQSELAARMSITASQLSLIEAGKRQPSLRVVGELARAVGIPTALISLLASPTDDMDSRRDEDVSDLARALLRVLVSAKEDPRKAISLEES